MEWQKLHSMLYTFEEQHEALKNEKKELVGKINEAEKLVDENVRLKKRVSDLEKQVSNLEEEKQSFTKVSHIINLERENSKLRSELELLNNKLKKPAVSEEYREKKIKGVVYLLSNSNNLYEKLEDNKPGELVGRIERTDDGKQRVTWNL